MSEVKNQGLDVVLCDLIAARIRSAVVSFRSVWPWTKRDSVDTLIPAPIDMEFSDRPLLRISSFKYFEKLSIFATFSFASCAKHAIIKM